ncbi:hypothetical protein LTR84_006430 [Exophiala bonariae]|uniref:Xylanolytic transcriptional activator regulatory domain-containing protein n=1 Tax=Exophiala bonariae TaxID=1690606 RepID=A0AAV9N4P7_9EURO|nr:hypothetical protein LTR84_006430 [Exophiala bonariae]
MSLRLHPGQPLPPDVDLFLNLTVLPSPPIRPSEFQPTGNGIKAIYEILNAEGSSLESSVLQWTDAQDRLERYRRTYFQTFHIKWPILHAPTFGIQSAPLQLAASVCLLGSWFMNPTGDERSYALKVHDILLQRLLTSLMNQELITEGQGWPGEHFQAVLLTLIFSLYRTDAIVLSKATHLRNVFITTLRDLGAFNDKSLGAHLEAYYSGSYAPYALSMRERFKRLSALTYQFDTYFALARKIPPLMHHQEISIPLPSTFMVWNTYGLDILPIRQREEPPERSLVAVSTMISRRNSQRPLQFLVEDVQLGLCGLLQAIWAFTQPFTTNIEADYGNAAQRAMLTKKLDIWKHELDTINGFADLKNIQSDKARYLYLAYRGENNFIAPSLERMSALVQDTMILYYFLRLLHYAGLNAPSETTELGPAENSNLGSSQEIKDDREALVCALQLLAMAETSGASSQLPSFNPLTYHALRLGMHVVQVVLSKQVCDCAASDGQQQATTNDLRQWAENGGRAPWINESPICVCTFERCTERFQNAIRDRKPLLE